MWGKFFRVMANGLFHLFQFNILKPLHKADFSLKEKKKKVNRTSCQLVLRKKKTNQNKLLPKIILPDISISWVINCTRILSWPSRPVQQVLHQNESRIISYDEVKVNECWCFLRRQMTRREKKSGDKVDTHQRQEKWHILDSYQDKLQNTISQTFINNKKGVTHSTWI